MKLAILTLLLLPFTAPPPSTAPQPTTNSPTAPNAATTEPAPEPIAAPLIPGAQAIAGDINRYHSPRSYKATIKYYKRYFRYKRHIHWHNIINTPRVRAKHIANRNQQDSWQGLNIYEHQGHVKIYVLAPIPKPATTQPAATQPTAANYHP